MSVSLIIKYSATISATDSVAALTLISPVLQPKLFSIIFGEGMVNDAVAIILFKVVGSYWLIFRYVLCKTGDIADQISSESDMTAGDITI